MRSSTTITRVLVALAVSLPAATEESADFTPSQYFGALQEAVAAVTKLGEVSAADSATMELSQALVDNYFSAVAGHEWEALLDVLYFQSLEKQSDDRDVNVLLFSDYLFRELVQKIPEHQIIEKSVSIYGRYADVDAKTLDALIGAAFSVDDVQQSKYLLGDVLKTMDPLPVNYIVHIYERTPSAALNCILYAFYPDAGGDSTVVAARSLSAQLINFKLKDASEKDEIEVLWTENIPDFERSEFWPIRAFAAAVAQKYPIGSDVSHGLLLRLETDSHPVVRELATSAGLLGIAGQDF